MRLILFCLLALAAVVLIGCAGTTYRYVFETTAASNNGKVIVHEIWMTESATRPENWPFNPDGSMRLARR